MNKSELDHLEERLRDLPKPSLEKEKALQMSKTLFLKAELRKVRVDPKSFKPFFAGITGIAVFALLTVLIFSTNGNGHPPKNASVAPPPRTIVSPPQQIDDQNIRDNIVDEWAAAVKSRNGKIQYNLLSADLQQKVLEPLQQMGFSTGQSSPWVESFDAGTGILTNDKAMYTVTFQLAASTGAAGKMNVELILMKENNQWVISYVSADQEFFPYTSSKEAESSSNTEWEQLTRQKRYEGIVLATTENTITIKVNRNLPYDTDPVKYPDPGYTIKLNMIEQGDEGFLSGKIKKGTVVIVSVATYKKAEQQIDNGTFYSEIYLKNGDLYYDVNGNGKGFLDF